MNRSLLPIKAMELGYLIVGSFVLNHFHNFIFLTRQSGPVEVLAASLFVVILVNVVGLYLVVSCLVLWAARKAALRGWHIDGLLALGMWASMYIMAAVVRRGDLSGPADFHILFLMVSTGYFFWLTLLSAVGRLFLLYRTRVAS